MNRQTVLTGRPLATCLIFSSAISYLLSFANTVLRIIALTGAVAAAVFWLFLHRKLHIKGPFLLTAVLCVFVSALSLLTFSLPAARIAPYDERSCQIVGTVESVVHDDYMSVIVVDTELIDNNVIPYPIQCKSYEHLPVTPGMQISFTATVRAVASEDDTARTLLASGIRATAVYESDTLSVLSQKTTFASVTENIRQNIAGVFDRCFSSDGASLLRAVLLGDRDALSSADATVFRRTGVSHLLALSGMHLTVLTYALHRLLNLFRTPKKVRNILSLFFIVLYIVLTGFLPSLIRAGIMTALFLLSQMVRRPTDRVTNLVTALFTILLFYPLSTCDVGLLLSFLATLGIVLFSESKESAERQGKKRSGIFISFFCQPVLISLSATLFTFPVTAIVFGEMSLVFLPANLLFPLLLEWLVYLALPALALPFLRPLVSRFSEGYLYLLRAFSSLKGIYISVDYIEVIVCSFLLLSAILLLFFIRKKKWWHIAFPLLPLCVIVLSLSFHTIDLKRQEDALYLSAGRGDYLLYRDEGETVLFSSSALSENAMYTPLGILSEMHESELDTFILTHYDDDLPSHLMDFSSRIRIHEVVLPTPLCDIENALAREVESLCETYHIRLTYTAPKETYTVSSVSYCLLPRASLTVNEHAYAYFINAFGIRTLFVSPSYQLWLPYSLNYYDCTQLDALIVSRHGEVLAEPVRLHSPRSLRTLLLGSEESRLELTLSDAAYLKDHQILCYAPWRYDLKNAVEILDE